MVNSGTVPICCICRDTIDEKADLENKSLTRRERNERKLATTDVCTHVFHVGCIREWFNTENSCPLCKRKCHSLTFVKPNCKRKKTQLKIEDKRQRPDHFPFNLELRMEHQIEDIQGSLVSDALRMVSRQIRPPNDADPLEEYRCNFTLGATLSPLSLFGPTYFFNFILPSSMYTHPARTLTVVLFIRSSSFRTLMLHLLNIQQSPSDVGEAYYQHTRLARKKAHMAFEVIIRSWFHINNIRRIYDMNESDRPMLIRDLMEWIDQAMLLVCHANRHTAGYRLWDRVEEVNARWCGLMHFDDIMRDNIRAFGDRTKRLHDYSFEHTSIEEWSRHFTLHQCIIHVYSSITGIDHREYNNIVDDSGSVSSEDHFRQIYIV